MSLDAGFLSRRGSYWAMKYYVSNKDTRCMRLISHHGDFSSVPLAFIPTIKGEKAICDNKNFFDHSEMLFDGCVIKFAFADDNTIVINGQGNECGLVIENVSSAIKDDYIAELKGPNGTYYIVTNEKTNHKFIIYASAGNISLKQKKNGKTFVSRLIVNQDNSEFQIVVKEIEHNVSKCNFKKYDFDKLCEDSLESFKNYYEKFRKPQNLKWLDSFELSVWNIWSLGIKSVDPCLTRDLVNICPEEPYNSATSVMMAGKAVAETYPDQALDYVMAFFDHQDKEGCIPSSIDDTKIHWLFMKTPIQGYYFSYLSKYLELSNLEKEDIYKMMSKWLNWWFEYRNINDDDILEYHHNKEYGQNEMDYYGESFDAPDLSSCLVISMDYLSKLAKELGKDIESLYWKERADKLSFKTIRYFVDSNNEISLKTTFTREKINSSKIDKYMILNCGSRMRKDMLDELVKQFVNNYGDDFEPDSKSDLNESLIKGTIILDSLYQLGYETEALKTAASWCEKIKKNPSDNRNIITSGAYISLIQKYLEPLL